MVGRDVKLAPDKPESQVGAARLEIRGLEIVGDRGNIVVNGLSLEVRGGEILGIAGVSGNGQRELAEAIAGLRGVRAGSIAIDGARMSQNQQPADVRKHGLAYVPEGRMKDGSIGTFTVVGEPAADRSQRAAVPRRRACSTSPRFGCTARHWSMTSP